MPALYSFKHRTHRSSPPTTGAGGLDDADERRAVLTDCGLRPSALRMLVLEMAEEIAEQKLDGPAILRRLYERGQFVPMSSLYRVLNEFDRLGLLERASGRGWPRNLQSTQAGSGVHAQRG